MINSEIISSALGYLSADCCREEWVQILMSIKSTLGDDGYGLAEAWSAQSDQFKPQDFLLTWRSISSEGGVTLGTLIHLARSNGWTEGTAVKFNPAPKRTPVTQSPPKTFTYAVELLRGAGTDGVESHPYAVAKGIDWSAGALRGRASGSLIGQDGDCVIVPMRDLDGQFRGVECINQDGTKQTFGRKGVLILGNDLSGELTQLIVEGWATAARTLHAFKGDIAVYACFGKGKMQQLADQLETRYPGRRVVMMVEQDG